MLMTKEAKVRTSLLFERGIGRLRAERATLGIKTK